MAKNKVEYVEPEWSHVVNVDTIEEAPASLSIQPDEEQAKALLRRLDVIAVEGLRAELTLQRMGQSIYVKGYASGTVTQNCAVTMEPINTDIHEEFEAWYADADQAVSISKARRERDLKKGHSEVKMLDESEDPEPIVNGQIDVGELAVQYLSLGIDPYAHAEGAIYDGGDEKERDEPSELRKNPFAALKDWKDKLK